jgi:hypothetical protein
MLHSILAAWNIYKPPSPLKIQTFVIFRIITPLTDLHNKIQTHAARADRHAEPTAAAELQSSVRAVAALSPRS